MCVKTPFRDRVAADMAVINIRRGSRRARVPIRSYRCPRCRRWHLTSQPPRREKP